MTTGFDNELYLDQQSRYIVERSACFSKLYLEFGGKLVHDNHAARVLPGYDPNVKIRLLEKIKDKIDIIICVYAGDIETRKMRGDFGIGYDADVLKLIDDLRVAISETVPSAVVITRFDDQPVVKQFMNHLTRRDIQVHVHKAIKGYPTDIDTVVSDSGYGANAFIETTKPIVVVTGPGPNSGKMATCLSQCYHEQRRGVSVGYAKFETFPIWNLPLKHPVNMAYESATADLGDFNQVDPFHLDAYGIVATNYNRDIDSFPILQRVMARIAAGGASAQGAGPGTAAPGYRSPTDMGVNRAGFAIVSDDACKEAARREIVRRYLRYRCEHAMGLASKATVDRADLIMKELGLDPLDRKVVSAAREAAARSKERGKGHQGIHVGAAIEFPDETIVTGSNSILMHAASAVVLNAIKHLAGIPSRIDLISKTIIESIGALKKSTFNETNPSMNLDEMLIALGISAATNPATAYAVERLKDLKGCEMHLTHIPTSGDDAGLRRLGMVITSDPSFSSKALFID